MKVDFDDLKIGHIPMMSSSPLSVAHQVNPPLFKYADPICNETNFIY